MHLVFLLEEVYIKNSLRCHALFEKILIRITINMSGHMHKCLTFHIKFVHEKPVCFSLAFQLTVSLQRIIALVTPFLLGWLYIAFRWPKILFMTLQLMCSQPTVELNLKVTVLKYVTMCFFNAEAANKYSINFCLRALMNNIFAIFFAVIIFLIKHRTNHSNVRCQICIQYNIYCQLKFWRHFTKCYRLQQTGC